MLPDRAALATPIAGDEPSGEWLRREGTYAAVQEAMRADPGDPSYGIPEKRADWAEVVSICVEALSTKTKDFYLACCLLEALAHTDGPAGLAEGMWFVAELHERFWDDFHPRPRDDGKNVDARMNQLEALSSGFERVLDALPVTETADVIRRLDWRYIFDKPEGAEPSAWTADQVADGVRSSPWDFYDNAVRHMRAAQAELRRLDDQLDVRYPRDVPSLLPVREKLEGCLAMFMRLLRERGPSPYEEQARSLLEQTGCSLVELEWLAEKVREGVPSTRLLNSLMAAVADAAAGMVPDEGWPSFLGGLWGRDETYAQRSEAAPVIVETAPVAPVSTPTAHPVRVDIKGRDPLGIILSACQALRASDPGNPAAYVIPREILWQPLERADPSGRLPGPPSGRRSQCSSLFESGRWQELLDLCEGLLLGGEGYAWLDLQRYVCAAMGQIGAPYGPPRRAVLRVLRGVVEQVPWLLEATLADGEASADEITRNWISVEVRAGGGGNAPHGAPAAVENETLSRALALLESEGLEAAIGESRNAVASARFGRARAQRLQDLAEVCLRGERPDLAAPILEGLRADLHRRNLGDWEDPDFLGRALEALYRSYTLMEVSSGSGDAPIRKREVADELARVDLTRRLRLDELA